ncbi:MAG: prenyltransferase [Acidimicrobiales bacterium]
MNPQEMGPEAAGSRVQHPAYNDDLGGDLFERHCLGTTAETVAGVQLQDGMIPWFPGGHCDPWNHVEAAMALLVAGYRVEAERAFQWLASTQLPDGSWYNYYLESGIEDYRKDTNVCAYVATGVWFHYLHTKDAGFLASMWPVVARAIDFVLAWQCSDGTVLWSLEPDGTPGSYALLTGSSSIYLSLRCAVACAEQLGLERPEWELSAGRLRHAILRGDELFEPKRNYAMDWYYPVLSGAVRATKGIERIRERWMEFVMGGLGVRCVSERPWVTAAETAECVIALDCLGLSGEARALFETTRGLRCEDGSYWTGLVFPEQIPFPGGERSTYTAAAVVLAANALAGQGASSGLFRGEGLPDLPDLSASVGAVADPAQQP